TGDSLAMPVYAGGDDLLAFCPASTAIDAARTCHDEIPPSLPHASTAVLFFHYHASIQQAMHRARHGLLEAAKQAVPGEAAALQSRLRDGPSRPAWARSTPLSCAPRSPRGAPRRSSRWPRRPARQFVPSISRRRER
ncbi:MAG: Cas10/Cmr2 second palm domain-containing protein, partial [Streptosporangiaceae bacterium]